MSNLASALQRGVAPSLCAAFCFGAGVLNLSATLPPDAVLRSSFVALLLAAALLLSLLLLRLAAGALQKWLSGNLRIVAAMLWLCLAAAAGYAYAAHWAQQTVAQHLPTELEGHDLRVTGRVSKMPSLMQRGQRFAFVIESAQLEGKPLPQFKNQTVLLSWYEAQASAQPASRYSFTVRLKRRHAPQNPHGFDYERWLFEHRIFATGYVRSSNNNATIEPAHPTQPAEFRLTERIELLRSNLRHAVFAASPSAEAARWVSALGLGDQRIVPEAVWQTYNATGVGHLLSVSGVHVTMLGGLLGFLAAWLWARKPARLLRIPAVRIRLIATCIGALAYALLSGWSLPAQRTVLMLWVCAVALYASGQRTPWHALAIAAAAAVLQSPMAISSPSFWLSFAAVAVLISIDSPYAVETKPDQSGLQAIATPTWRLTLRTAAQSQLLLWLALLPIGAIFFNQFSVVSPLANAIAIPLIASLVAPLALLVLLLLWLAPVASALMQLIAFLQEAILSPILTTLAQLPFASLAVPALPWYVALLTALGLLWLWQAPRWLPAPWRSLRHAGWLSFAPYAYAMLFSLNPAPQWQVWVMDVGQGTSVLIRSGAHSLLYDAGPRYSVESDGAGRVILPMLRGLGVQQLDTVVLSHVDEDHTGGVATLHSRIGVKQWLGSVPQGHSLRGIIPAVSACPVGDAAQSEAWAGLQLQWLFPAPSRIDTGGKPNHASCVLRVSDGKFSVLLAGDIEVAQEAELVAQYGEALRSTVLIAPHHGSNTSSTAAFLAAVQPEMTVMQLGYRNRYGHPHGDVLQRYAALNLPVLRTDLHGAVGWQISPETGEVQRTVMRRDAPRFWQTRLD